MSVKHLGFLCALFCSSTFAANGIPIPNYTPALYGPYLEGELGAAIVDWKHFGSQFGPRVFADGVATGTRYAEGGLMGGVDGGYQFNKNFAVEVGAIALPRAKATGEFSPLASPVSSEANTFFLYAGGKIQKQFAIDNFVFFKLGAAYRYTSFRASSEITGDSFSQKGYHFLPMFALGMTHFFTPAFSINFEYMHVPAIIQHFVTFPGGNVSSVNAPAANVFLIGLGYMYNGTYQGIE
ncbi:outer membrane beta-barrel protein [Candidiatus Paracoxiella cheracis]|uniref:outer membrane beta-barrel protein n=1 Tax=Candidiatus Paracoxiella cheracis TaxID=3405120 RepID=UPI003BF4AD0A